MTEENIQNLYQNSIQNKKKLLKILIPLIIFLILLFLFIIYWQKGKNPTIGKKNTPIPEIVISKTEVSPTLAPNIIALVGEEKIFEEDIIYEKLFTPPPDKEKTSVFERYLLDKIIEDSILLQENKNKINLGSDIYNHPQKDYTKRTQIADRIRKQTLKDLQSNIISKEGYIVSVWTFNTRPSILGIDKAKEMAFDKIFSLHEEVAQQTINIKEAGEKIRNDISLLQIDYYYKENAITPFKITSENDVCTGCIGRLLPELWTLNEGGVTKIFYVKQSQNEEYYTFGQVTKINGGKNYESYSDWLGRMKKRYEIQLF